MFKRKLNGLLQLFRLELTCAAGLCVVAGEVLALGRLPTLWQALLGFACGFFISAAAIVFNDYFDLEVDRVNISARPLPAGVVSPAEAIGLAIVASCLGLVASLALGLTAFLLCLALWIIGFLYNWKFKSTGLVGNLMVSTSVGMSFILGGVTVGAPWNRLVWVFAAMAFFIDLGEEIAGDTMDMEGDKRRGSRSISLRRGRKFALALSVASFVMVAGISLVPALCGWLGWGYIAMIVLTDALILWQAVRLTKSRTSQEGRRIMRWIYLGELLGLVAFVVGQFVF